MLPQQPLIPCPRPLPSTPSLFLLCLSNFRTQLISPNTQGPFLTSILISAARLLLVHALISNSQGNQTSQHIPLPTENTRPAFHPQRLPHPFSLPICPKLSALLLGSTGRTGSLKVTSSSQTLQSGFSYSGLLMVHTSATVQLYKMKSALAATKDRVKAPSA